IRVPLRMMHEAWAEAGRLRAVAAGLGERGVQARGRWASQDASAALSSTLPDPAAQLQRHVFAARGRVPERRGQRRLAAVAAVAVCALALGWGWRELAPAPPVRHATALGDVRSLDLADGSQATLASDSRIAVRLSHRARRIALE